MKSNRGTHGFIRNPLLLSLTAIAVENNDSFALPTHRGALYREALETLLGRRKRPGSNSSLPAREVTLILQYLAYSMFISGKETVSEDDLYEMIENYQRQSSKPFIRDIPSDSIAIALVEDIGVLDKYAKSSYRFIHLTFQEYLTAVYLSKIESWEEVIVEHLLDPRWEEVIRLLTSIITPDRINVLLSLFENDTDTLLADKLCLVGRCIGDAPHTEIAEVKAP